MDTTRGRLLRALAMLAIALTAIAGPGTADVQAADRSCSARTALGSRPTLAPGDSGTCVRALQNLLLTKGYTLGEGWPGGRLDTATTRAVRLLQERQGLPVTGRVDGPTWRALSSSTMRPGYNRWRGPNRTSMVVLSYDDCPRSGTGFRSTLLEAERLGIALAVLPTGQCLRTGRVDTAWARAHGHYVFNHSVSHPDLRTLSYSAAYRELGSPGVVTTYGRPPYGATDATARRAYAARGMQPWIWTYDTADYTGVGQSTIVGRVVDNATPSTSVLMHMQYPGFSPAALRSMKSGLAARGLSICRNHVGTTPARPTSMRC